MAIPSPAQYRPECQARPELLSARNGMPTLRIGDTWVHSSYDPEREADAWARSLIKDRKKAEETLWVVFGCGLGYHILSLQNSGATSLIVYEPDGRILMLREQEGLVKSGRGILLTSSTDELRDHFRAGYPDSASTRLVTLPAYARLYPDQLADFEDRLCAYVQEIKSDHLTYVSFAAEWLLLTIQNMPTMVRHPTIQALAGRARGRPAVVVSPGPSLDKNIGKLAEHQDRFLILCPSQSLKALDAAGIRADLVVVADSQKLDYHFKGCPEESHRNLVLPAKIHPSVAALPAERRFFYHLPFNTLARTFFSLLSQGACDIPPGHSVSNLAFSLAIFMDADPVVLMGQDLAFSGNKMYCDRAVDGGQALHFQNEGNLVSMRHFASKLDLADSGGREALLKRLSAPQRVVWVKGQDGELLASTNGLKAMLTWFERTAEAMQNGRCLINATEGGAFIRGMDHRTFREVVRDFAPDETVRLEDMLGHSKTVSPSDIQKVFVGLRRMASEFASLERTARRCDRLAKSVLQGGGADPSALVALEKIEKKLKRLLSRLPAVDALVQDALRHDRARGEVDQDDLAANLERSRHLYKAVAQGSRTLKEAFQMTLKKGAGE